MTKTVYHPVPLYTTRERILIILKRLLWSALLYCMFEFWLYDWISEYAENAHCQSYGNITGTHLVVYGTYSGLPLMVCCFILILQAKRSFAIIKLGQKPLPGEKVFRRISYKYGLEARVDAIAVLMIAGSFLAFSIWGATYAYKSTLIIRECIPH